MFSVLKPNVPIFQSNCVEGLHFSAFHKFLPEATLLLFKKYNVVVLIIVLAYKCVSTVFVMCTIYHLLVIGKYQHISRDQLLLFTSIIVILLFWFC